MASASVSGVQSSGAHAPVAEARLEAFGLRKTYGRREVVKGIDVGLKPGEIVGLLGPNGAGKTTTFHMLVGIIRPTQGGVRLNGQDVTDLPLHERARRGVSYLPQESSVFKKLTVRENLLVILEHMEFSGSSPRKAREKRADELLEELGITHIAGQKALHMSGGERRRLEIARALIRRPLFILLDEPFAGIDPLAVDDIQRIVAGLKARGIGVLISDHNVRETLRICDRASLVYEGTIILEGPPEAIVADARARRVYLGEEFCL